MVVPVNVLQHTELHQVNLCFNHIICFGWGEAADWLSWWMVGGVITVLYGSMWLDSVRLTRQADSFDLWGFCRIELPHCIHTHAHTFVWRGTHCPNNGIHQLASGLLYDCYWQYLVIRWTMMNIICCFSISAAHLYTVLKSYHCSPQLQIVIWPVEYSVINIVVYSCGKCLHERAFSKEHDLRIHNYSPLLWDHSYMWSFFYHFYFHALCFLMLQ